MDMGAPQAISGGELSATSQATPSENPLGGRWMDLSRALVLPWKLKLRWTHLGAVEQGS